MKLSYQRLRQALTLTMAVAALVPFVAIQYGVSSVERVQAASVDQLKKEKERLEQQARQAESQAKSQKTVAQQAAERLQKAASEISQLESSIQQTDSQMASTQQEINQKNQEIAELEAELRKVKDQQDALVREMYMRRISLTDQLMLLSNQPVSKRQQEQAEFEAIKKFVGSLHAKTMTAKAAVEESRGKLVARSTELENLKAQQQQQRVGLSSVRQEQAMLRENAESAVATLEAQAKEARQKEARIEQQISAALTAAINAARGGTISGPGVGGRVQRGAVVGHLGSTGNSTGPHVHFEVRNTSDVAVNPMPYISNGTLTWPVTNYYISQGFGYTSYAAGGAYGGSIHTGIDMAGPYGQPVYAPADGTVILNQYYGGYGYAWAARLDNGLVVLLGHMTGK